MKNQSKKILSLILAVFMMLPILTTFALAGEDCGVTMKNIFIVNEENGKEIAGTRLTQVPVTCVGTTCTSASSGTVHQIKYGEIKKIVEETYPGYEVLGFKFGYYDYLTTSQMKDILEKNYQDDEIIKTSTSKSMVGILVRTNVPETKTHTLKYDVTGGSSTVVPTQTQEGSVAGMDFVVTDIVPTVEDPSLYFVGWRVTGSAASQYSKTYVAGDTINVNGEITLQSNWGTRDVTHYLHYKSDAVSEDFITDKVSAPKGDCEFTITQYKPDKNGYVCIGWSEECDSETADYVSGGKITVESEKTLYAVWQLKPVDLDGDSGNDYFPAVNVGDEVAMPNPGMKPGFTFEGWSVNGSKELINVGEKVTVEIGMKIVPVFTDDSEDTDSDNCDCICHKTNFFSKFMASIMKFFWRLFGINKVCDCGINHY